MREGKDVTSKYKKKCWQNNATKQGSFSEADSCPLRLPSVPYLGW
jgi:hypothetical protein